MNNLSERDEQEPALPTSIVDIGNCKLIRSYISIYKRISKGDIYIHAYK